MEKNIKTLLLDLLISEKTNVATAKQEVEHYQASVEHHKNRIQGIRVALEALGIESENSQHKK